MTPKQALSELQVVFEFLSMAASEKMNDHLSDDAVRWISQELSNKAARALSVLEDNI